MQIIKVGGNELADASFLQGLAQSVKAIQTETKQPVVIVHGGGKAIADLQSKLGLEAKKVDGLRVTDAPSMQAAEMVLSGHSNKLIVKALLATGVDAIGLSGIDGGLLRCKKRLHPTADLGFVGNIVEVRTDLLTTLAAQGFTAVISPISLGVDGHTYNVNADDGAMAVALALKAELLNFVSNVPGVLKNGERISTLTIDETEALIAEGVITDGMIPKVRAACTAVSKGVAQARIVNLAGLTQQLGTIFTV